MRKGQFKLERVHEQKNQSKRNRDNNTKNKNEKTKLLLNHTKNVEN